MNLGNILSERNLEKSHMLHDSIYMKCQEQANLWRHITEWWLLGARNWGGWGVTTKLQAFLRGSEDFLELVMCTF